MHPLHPFWNHPKVLTSVIWLAIKDHRKDEAKKQQKSHGKYNPES